MKKFGFIALALGLFFVAACNNAGTSGSGDSTSIDSTIDAAGDTSLTAPVDTSAISDTTVFPVDSAK